MKKLPLFREPDEFDEAITNIVAVFGRCDVIADAAAEHTSHTNVRVNQHETLEESIALLIAAGQELLKKGPLGEKRRLHVFVCQKCGDPCLVTSGPKGHTGKSTLRGGCFRCKPYNRKARGGATLAHVKWAGEIVRLDENVAGQPQERGHTNG